MVFRLSLFLVLQIYTVILMFFAFFGRMLTSIVALFSLVFPSLVARGQAAVFSTTVSVKRESVQPMELDWIWAICVSLLGQKPATSQDVRFKLFPTPLAWSFSPLTNVSPLWCSLTILKATWLLAIVGYVSAREVGKASAGIVGHVSRQLIKHIWNLGLIQFQTLRLDVLNRLEVTGFAPHDRVTSQPFFGLRLGQITSFDPCLSHSLKLWTLALIYRLLDPDQPGDPCGDSLMEVRKRDTGNQTLRSEKTMGFEDSSQRRRVGQPKGYKDGHTLCGSSTTHSRRQTRNTLRPSILEVPIPGFFVCTTNDGYSAAKHYEDCGETEQFFCDYPFDHASWLLTAILDKVPSFCAVDTDCRGTMKSVQLHKLKASNKDKQRILPITVIILQQIQDSSPSTQRLEYLLPASASTVLNVAHFSAMNCLGIVYFDIQLNFPGNVKHVNVELISFNCDSVPRARYPEFTTQPRINEVNLSLLYTTLKNQFGTEDSNAPVTSKGEAYSYGIDNSPGMSYAIDGHCVDDLFTCPEVYF